MGYIAVLLVVFFFSAGSLYWTFNFGDCEGGCEEGMAFILFLPSLLIAGASGLAAVGLYFVSRRNRSDDR